MSENPFSEALEAALMHAAFASAKQCFAAGIVECMRQEQVNLESAIVMVREHLEYSNATDPLKPTPEQQAQGMRCFEEAAEWVRTTFAQMRQMIAWDDEGATEPKPHDPRRSDQARVDNEFSAIISDLGPLGSS